MASGLAETAKLVASLVLEDHFSPGANKAMASLGKLEGRAFRVGQNIGKGISNAAKNIAKIGVALGVALTGAVAVGIRSLGDLQRAQNQTAAVIESTGGKAGVSAVQIREMAEALEKVTTVDDKVIQDGENLLLTFTGIGKTVFPEATRAMVNLGIAMAGGNVEQVDLKASAIQLGKALNDPIKGITTLTRVGVSFTEQQKSQIVGSFKLTKEEQKQYSALLKTNKAKAKAFLEAKRASAVLKGQQIILAELNKEFGKAGEAAGKGPEAVWRRLQDVGEDLSQVLARGLLPVLERAGTWLSTKLADPAFVAVVDDLGQSLGRAGDAVLAWVEKLDFKAIGAGMSAAAGAAKTIAAAFMGLPAWVQTAVLTGWGLNKLTGGALGGIAKELGGIVFDIFGSRGSSPANPLFVSQVGGLPGGTPGVVPMGGALSTVQKVFLVGEAIGLGLLVLEVGKGVTEAATEQSKAIHAQTTEWLSHTPSDADLRTGLAGVEQGIKQIESDPIALALGITAPTLAELKLMRADIRAALGERAPGERAPSDPKAPANRRAPSDPKPSDFLTPAKLQDTFDRAVVPTTTAVKDVTAEVGAAGAAAAAASTGAGRAAAAAAITGAFFVSSAVRAARPIITNNVDISISGTSVVKTASVSTSYGPTTSSREGNLGTFGGNGPR